MENIQPELETPLQKPIPVYDAATEARKAELDKAARKRMAEKDFESIGRGKAEVAYEERKYEKQRLQEERDEDEQCEWDERDLDNTIFFNEAAARLRKQDTSRNYDEYTLKILWATWKCFTTEEYDKQQERKRSRQVAKSVVPIKVLLHPRAHDAALLSCRRRRGVAGKTVIQVYERHSRRS